ncbi:MAG: chorismate-binding protein [Thermoflexales bacterium]|nr:chorismate-binding protein [Thermoflexales bacterium]
MPKLTIKPSIEEVRELSARGNLIPIYAELPSDLDTPVSLFLRLAGSDPAFLLESVDGGERIARYSFMGVRMREALVLRGRELVRHTLGEKGLKMEPVPIPAPDLQPGDAPREGDVLDALRAEMKRYAFVPLPNLPRFCGGLVGFTGYDVARQFEAMPDTARDALGTPDAVYVMADTLVAFDHARQRLLVIANAFVDGSESLSDAYDDAVARIKSITARLSAPLAELSSDPNAICAPARSNKTQDEYEALVLRAKEYINSGDTFQIQVSRRLARRTTAHPFAIYRALRRINPSPWMFYFDFGKLLSDPASSRAFPLRLIGASPEMHARFEDGIATVRPIAGTRRRGNTEAEDKAMAHELITDPKERAEHVMLVDLGRNDIGRIAKFGTVTVPDLMIIENYSHVMHIVSSVQGQVRDGLDSFDVLRATFPAGTLSGAPKVRTMEIIEELEGERRGIYGGCAGYFSFGGQMDTCIIIRTIVMIGDTCYLQAAGGVVADSTPTGEFKETANKLRATMVAIDEAEQT